MGGERVIDALRRRYPGQWRYLGAGVWKSKRRSGVRLVRRKERETPCPSDGTPVFVFGYFDQDNRLLSEFGCDFWFNNPRLSRSERLSQ
jgi:hypothetical protein